MASLKLMGQSPGSCVPALLPALCQRSPAHRQAGNQLILLHLGAATAHLPETPTSGQHSHDTIKSVWDPSPGRNTSNLPAAEMCRDQRGRMRFRICASLGGRGLVPAVAAQRPVIDQVCISRCMGKAHPGVQLQEEYWALLPLLEFMETHTSFAVQDRAVSRSACLQLSVPSQSTGCLRGGLLC